MSFFKKKDEDRKTVRPKLRPANFGSETKEKSGTSGKGGGQPAEPKYDVNAKGWSDQVAKFNKKGGINNDGRMGYGYVDTQTGVEVPWYIDMINGGGANAAGDTFVSPFEGTIAGLPAQAVTGGLNAMGVAPYGSNRPRYFMPMEAARVDASGAPVQVDLGAAPRPNGGGLGGDTGNVSKNLLGIPNSMTDDDMGLPAGPLPSPDPYAPIGGSNPAVQAEIARRQEAQRMMSYEPLGEGLYGTVEDVHFGPRPKRAQPTSLLDTRQQVPQPDEARALQAIADNNMMPDFINLPPYQQRAMITAMLERGY